MKRKKHIGSMKIVEVTEWYIKFDDNSIITYTHEQSCTATRNTADNARLMYTYLATVNKTDTIRRI